MLLYQLNTIISYTSIVLLPSYENKKYRLFLVKAIFSRIIMQLLTFVLKEDNSLHNQKPLSRVDVRVKFLFVDYKAIFLITWLLRLVQVTKLCPYLLSLDHRPKITHLLPNLFFATGISLLLFSANMTIFLLVDSCLFVGMEPCLRQSIWVAAPAVV